MKIGNLLVLAALTLAASVATGAEVDAVVANVDGVNILRSEVVDEMRRMGSSAEQYDDVLDEMINRKLILKAAAEAKMSMQEWVIDNRVREIITKAFDGDRNRLMDTLAKQKVSYAEWRQRIRDDLVSSAMRYQVIDKDVHASPADMREEYAKHPERYVTDRRVTVSVILLKPENAARRDEIVALLKTNDFAAVAKAWSAGPHAAEGGVWKDVDPAKVFRPEVGAALAKMKVGETSGWIDIGGWNFLVRYDAETPAHARSFAEAYADIELNVRTDRAERLYAEWIVRLRNESYVKKY